MTMLILLQLTLVANLYFFGYNIRAWNGEIAAGFPNQPNLDHNFYCNNTISGTLDAYLMAFATILNIYKW